LLFFPATVRSTSCCPGPVKTVVLAASWFFYLCAGPECVAFIMCATWSTIPSLCWSAGWSRPKAMLTLLLTLLFGTLVLFKYWTLPSLWRSGAGRGGLSYPPTPWI
jgi:hypothetical protein